MNPLRRLRSLPLSAWTGPQGALGLVLAVLLTLGYAWWLFETPFMHGTAPFWWSDHTDISQYLSGFNAFVHEPWHWPLLRIESLNTPEGTLATYLDTVPLYALLLKLLRPRSGYWNPYGAWIAICFVLQGVGAWWICREARLRNWVALAALALLLASFPSLARRVPHTSLMSQWLLLFALAAYLRSARLGRLATGSWVALLPCAFYINIYLFTMSSVIFAADVLRELLRRPHEAAARRRALLAPVLAYGLLFASLWITMLPLPPGAGSGEWGFGYFSMNLLAPLDGGTLLLFDHPQGTPGQGEGANYLGIFLLALTGLVIRLRARHDPGFWRRHRALLGALVLLTAYALSNEVYLGEVRLFRLHLPEWTEPLTATFRSSGRFFWPVGYAIVVFTVLGAARYLKGWILAPLLAAVVALQLWDLQEHHARVHKVLSQDTEQVLDTARWDAFLGSGITALHYYPPFHCGATADSLRPVMVYAVRHGYTLSTGYIARASKACTGYAGDIARLPASTAVAFDKQVYPREADARALMGSAATCADMDFVFLCRRGPDSVRPLTVPPDRAH